MKLYVGNISFNLNSQDIRSIFSEYGKIDSAEVIYDRATGRSRGFAFVRMSSDDEGENAIENLHGTMVDARALVVSESKPSVKSRGGDSFAEQNYRNNPASTYYGGRSW